MIDRAKNTLQEPPHPSYCLSVSVSTILHIEVLDDTINLHQVHH